ncbi:hypothetical protein BJX64DRAFT_301737 [Aspergillus heterothallicus]
MSDRSDPKFQADFLFVHYQDDKPQNRTSSLSRKKAVFAQKSHQRQKRLAAAERLKTSTLSLRRRLPLAYNEVDDSHRTGQHDTGKEDDSTADPSGVAQQLQFFTVKQLKDLFSPQSQLGQGFSDPFSTAAIQMDESMDLYWHHYRNFILPLAYPLNSSPMGSWWWQKGLSEPVIHLTLLVSAAGHKIATDTITNAPLQELQRSKRQYMSIQGDTIKRLNFLLQDPGAVVESTTLTVAALRAIEAISCNIDCVAVHTTGLNALIYIHGGLENLDHQTLFQIYHSDIMYAALTDSAPARPLIPRWRREILQETMVFYSNGDLVSHVDSGLRARLSMLGTSFFEASWYSGLADGVKTLLRASQRLIQYYEAGRVLPSTVMPTDNSLFLVLGHQLLSVRYTLSPVEEVHQPAISYVLNEALRITMFIYLNMRVWNFQEYPIMHRLVNSLRTTLLGPSDTNDAPATTPTLALTQLKRFAPDALFWILFIGGMAAKGHDNEQLWFVQHLADLATLLELREWEIAREVLGGFFYTDQSGQQRGEELWEQVVPSWLSII